MNGEKLKSYLDANSLTQAKFAKMVEATQPTVSSWINGDKTPTPSKALVIQEATKGAIIASEWYFPAQAAS